MDQLFALSAEAGRRAFGATIEWFTKRVIRSLAKCPQCGGDHSCDVPNRTDTSFVCPNCAYCFDCQYTNATKHTVRSDRTIIAAQVQNFDWQIKQSPVFRTFQGYHAIADVLTANCVDNDILVDFLFEGRRSGKRTTKEVIISSKKRSEAFQRVSVCVDANELPDNGDNLEVTVRPIHGHEFLHRGVYKVLKQQELRWQHVQNGWSPIA